MESETLTLYDQNIWGNMPRGERIADRNALISGRVRACNADILCFQECNPTTSRRGDNPPELPTNAIADLLAPTFREAPTCAGENNYTPVFYRPDRLTLLESGYHPFAGKNDLGSKSITWAVLEQKTSGARLAVCSVHFWWKADTPEDNAARLDNAAVLWSKMSTLSARWDVPVIATGDLNCGAESPQGSEPYFALSAHLNDVRAIARETTACHTHHNEPHLGADDKYCGGSLPVRTLDHMFATRDDRLSVLRFSVDVAPDALNSSDHCPLVATLRVHGD